MRTLFFFLFLTCTFFLNAQTTVEDDFEGNGTITSWYGDDCEFDIDSANPYKTGINTSNKVLKYEDIGGQYANVGFDTPANFDLSENYTFSLKIYMASSDVTTNQVKQISLKLQDRTLGQPWSTQSEIIKPIVLDQWQTVTFNFKDDNYINLDPNSQAPTNRTDFNRVLLQVNGENNNDQVTAYIDDFLYDGTVGTTTTNVFTNLVWSDEFDGTGAIDTDKWFHQTQLPAGGSWYNGEIQHYTNREDNSYVNNGSLHLVAKKESFTDQGHTKQYTSARLNSKFAFTYGRVEVRAKLPTGSGTWPAIWMLGKNIIETGAYWTDTYGTTSWPACGEIDIMEHWGRNQNYVQSAMHTPSSHGATVNHGGRVISTVSSQFHVYALEWSSEKMVFTVDGIEHYTYNPETKNADTWPYDADQYMLLNIAIEPSIDPSFTESAMEIDYVRIYQEPTASTIDISNEKKIRISPNPVKSELTLQIPLSFKGTKATIYSLLGQKVEEFTVTNTVTKHNFSNYKKGIYILKLTNSKAVFTQKFLKI